MDFAFEVARYHDHAAGSRQRELAVAELFLLPDGCAVAAVEGVHSAALVCDEGIARIDAHAGDRRELARPEGLAGVGLEAGDAPLVRGGAHLAALQRRLTYYVGYALELVGALGQGHRRFPALRPVR